MKRYVFFVLAMAVGIYITGCTKKQPSLEEMQQPMSMEDLSRLGNSTQSQAVEPKPVAATASSVPAMPLDLAPLPPSGPYKPTAQEIQTALKTAGLYSGNIDGKIGPLTRKAVFEFQKTKGIQADGKVGPKTWALLSVYLNPPAEAPVKKKKK